VAVAIASHPNLSSEVISTTTLTKIVPVFVAIMVLLIRVLIIGTFSVKGGKLFSQADTHRSSNRSTELQSANSLGSHVRPAAISSFHQATKAARPDSSYARSDPSYRSVALQSKPVHEAEYVDTPRNS
jgi:hypothetical protein